jgi:hypothetical protein
MYVYSHGELVSIIKDVYKALNVSPIIYENEDWSALPRRIESLKESLDANEKRDRQITNLFSEESDHEADCSWHKDWHTCSCGFHDWLNEQHKLKNKV